MSKYHIEKRSNSYHIFDADAEDGERAIVSVGRYLPGPMVSLRGDPAGLYSPELAKVISHVMKQVAFEIQDQPRVPADFV